MYYDQKTNSDPHLKILLICAKHTYDYEQLEQRDAENSALIPPKLVRICLINTTLAFRHHDTIHPTVSLRCVYVSIRCVYRSEQGDTSNEEPEPVGALRVDGP